MSKSKPQQLTYTLAPLSARSHSHYNHHDQISSVTSTTQTRTAISPPQRSARPPRTHEPADDMIGQLSDLNTSGANTTICEYVKILTHNDYIQTEEPPKSLRSSTSEGHGTEVKVLKEVRMDRREGLDQMLELQKYRENGINYNRQSLAGKVLVTAPGHDDSATLVEFTDFVANTEPVVLDKENIPELKKERLNIGKIVIPPRMKANESKNCLQQSISKIAGGSAQHQNNISPSTSASITARKLREEHNMSHKGIETVPVSSRLMTSRTNEKDNYQTNPPSSIIKPLIQLTSPQIVTKKAKKSASAKSVLSHRNSHSSNLSSLQNPNKSLHKKFNPVPAPASRSVQAIVTPRGPYIIQNDENQKPLAPIKEEQGKTNERRANSKGDIKVKKDYKAMKATKIDLIEMDISRKYGQKRRDEKIEECSESLDIIYGMLRKAVSERKEGVSRSEQCMQKLEGLRDYMIETLSLVNNLKAE